MNYSEVDEEKNHIEAGIDVNDTCQSTTLWYDGLTPVVVLVRAGQYHTCGVRTDGAAVCWGSDSDGQASPPGAP